MYVEEKNITHTHTHTHIGFGTIHSFRHPLRIRVDYWYLFSVLAMAYYWYACLHSGFYLQFIPHPVAEDKGYCPA